jgi:hypothetical protein
MVDSTNCLFTWFTRLLNTLRGLAQSPGRAWVVLFLAIQVLLPIDGGTNTYSRWTTLVSMVEDKTVRIDNYHEHTIDWARTPDGHYYSNKAPGPMLLGLPVFKYLDGRITASAVDRSTRDFVRLKARTRVLQTLSVVTQAIPYAIVVLLFLRALQKRGVERPALDVAAVALLFGNTSSLFMNTYFGHGIAAMFVLVTLLSLYEKRYVQAGLWLGFATLCDYGAALLFLPAAIVVLWDPGRRSARVGRFFLGGVIPGGAWAWYHHYCFGSVFALPNKFQNPQFVGVPSGTPHLWGVLRLIPDPHVLWELLFGSARGLLYTQGWVLVTLAAILCLMVTAVWNQRFVIRDRLLRDCAIFSFVGLFLVLVMNCSFNGWHGGMTPGPRYLSIVLPPCAITLGLLYTRLTAFLRQAVVVSLTLSTVLFIFVYGTQTQLVPENELFSAYLRYLIDPTGTRSANTLYLLFAFGWLAYRTVRSSTTPFEREGLQATQPSVINRAYFAVQGDGTSLTGASSLEASGVLGDTSSR